MDTPIESEQPNLLSNKDPSNNPPEPPPSKVSPQRKWLRKLLWQAHWLLPNLIPDPYLTDREYEREHDRKENQRTRVPLELELRVNDLRTKFVANQAVSPWMMVSVSDQLRRMLAGGL